MKVFEHPLAIEIRLFVQCCACNQRSIHLSGVFIFLILGDISSVHVVVVLLFEVIARPLLVCGDADHCAPVGCRQQQPPPWVEVLQVETAVSFTHEEGIIALCTN